MKFLGGSVVVGSLGLVATGASILVTAAAVGAVGTAAWFAGRKSNSL